ncbi:unnamed protein product [Adineta ricciae]|uniref:G-protein coupled receptors family 1 profile domain-containing protein n=1 Tax=Adineta ricciae TaxID=249248 RepID=A0A816FGT7_ADIRI|nr:unnamed protein product [Adineta ricciae]
MFVNSMDCFLTYNLTCLNSTNNQLNSSSIVFGDALRPNLIAIDESSSNDLSTSTSSTPVASSILVSVQHCVITVLILGTIILSTITGNILVIAAIIIEKSLHSVAYYLFVSLAVTDLMIASMVSENCLRQYLNRSAKEKLVFQLLQCDMHFKRQP